MLKKLNTNIIKLIFTLFSLTIIIPFKLKYKYNKLKILYKIKKTN